MLLPSIAAAAALTSSGVLQSLTPPALPRPPAWICALTTHCSPPSALAASAAASGVAATFPAGTGMPYVANNSLAWYSWKFMRAPWEADRHAAAGDVTPHCANRGAAGYARPRNGAYFGQDVW